MLKFVIYKKNLKKITFDFNVRLLSILFILLFTKFILDTSVIHVSIKLFNEKWQIPIFGTYKEIYFWWLKNYYYYRLLFFYYFFFSSKFGYYSDTVYLKRLIYVLRFFMIFRRITIYLDFSIVIELSSRYTRHEHIY